MHKNILRNTIFVSLSNEIYHKKLNVFITIPFELYLIIYLINYILLIIFLLYFSIF